MTKILSQLIFATVSIIYTAHFFIKNTYLDNFSIFYITILGITTFFMITMSERLAESMKEDYTHKSKITMYFQSILSIIEVAVSIAFAAWVPVAILILLHSYRRDLEKRIKGIRNTELENYLK